MKDSHPGMASKDQQTYLPLYPYKKLKSVMAANGMSTSTWALNESRPSSYGSNPHSGKREVFMDAFNLLGLCVIMPHSLLQQLGWLSRCELPRMLGDCEPRKVIRWPNGSGQNLLCITNGSDNYVDGMPWSSLCRHLLYFFLFVSICWSRGKILWVRWVWSIPLWPNITILQGFLVSLL
jgi:hypothetical protein